MNVYLLIEDGERFCIRAENMAHAIWISERNYLDEVEKKEGQEFTREPEAEYYHREILQSCSLVGPLIN